MISLFVHPNCCPGNSWVRYTVLMPKISYLRGLHRISISTFSFPTLPVYGVFLSHSRVLGPQHVSLGPVKHMVMFKRLLLPLWNSIEINWQIWTPHARHDWPCASRRLLAMCRWDVTWLTGNWTNENLPTMAVGLIVNFQLCHLKAKDSSSSTSS